MGGNLSAAAATEYATIGANTLLSGGNVAAQAQSFGTYEYGKTAPYYDEFPQDIIFLGPPPIPRSRRDRHGAAG